MDKNAYYGCIIKGDLHGAMAWLRQEPEEAALYQQYVSIFEKEQYLPYPEDAFVSDVLILYQQYYRDVFYLRLNPETAAAKLQRALASRLALPDNTPLCDMEQGLLVEAFAQQGLHFMGGKTSGYYGPYVWRSTETVTHAVELPDGMQHYPVKYLNEFISQSWIHFLSFGALSPGGWSDGDGVINCARASYDMDSENFQVSLLKHEAQHAHDLTAWPQMPSAMLEYRAKLVELIYTVQRPLLRDFLSEADSSDEHNGHALAAHWIAEGFMRMLNLSLAELPGLPIHQVQATARKLFDESNRCISEHD